MARFGTFSPILLQKLREIVYAIHEVEDREISPMEFTEEEIEQTGYCQRIASRCRWLYRIKFSGPLYVSYRER